MPGPQKDSFFRGAATLASAVLIVKILGALYKIPLGAILTDAAFADFNTAYYIYALFLTISAGGLPVAVSKLVSEALALNRGNQIRKIFRLAMILFCILGMTCSAIMILFPGQLADLMNNSRSYWCILALAPAVFFLCPLAAIRGYFQGHSMMGPTAGSQVVEAVGKLVFGLSLAWILNAHGADESVCAAGASAGLTLSSVLSVSFLILCYWKHKKSGAQYSDVPESGKTILRNMLLLAIPITFSSSVMSVSNLIDTSMVQGRLQEAAGFSLNAARSLKGVYDKAVTIANLLPQFMFPLTASVIPAISSSISLKNYRQGAQISETALRTTALIIIPAGVGLFALSEPIIQLLYPSTDVKLAGWSLCLLGIGSIFICFMQIGNSILQAYRMVNVTIITTLTGCVIKILMNYFLVAQPEINIRGAGFSTIGAFSIISILNLAYMKIRLSAAPNYLKVFPKPIFCSVVMGVMAKGVYAISAGVLEGIGPFGHDGTLTRLGNVMGVSLSILAGMILYFLLVILTKAITREDLTLMPKGDQIARILKIQ